MAEDVKTFVCRKNKRDPTMYDRYHFLHVDEINIRKPFIFLIFNKGDFPMKEFARFLIVFAIVVFCFNSVQAYETEEITLDVTIRDFHQSHPDMQYAIATEKGIVETTLGTDKKPVYATTAEDSATTNGQESFDQWYRDVEGVNEKITKTLTLSNEDTGDANVYRFHDSSFFIIDNEVFGNEENSDHNFYFTLEAHAAFTYQGGETFSFTGDDDVWVFINDQRVIDLGGVHSEQSASVDLDTLGLTVGETYDFDIFFAERHTTQSNFKVDTSIALVTEPTPEPTYQP